MRKLSIALIGYGYWGKTLFKALQKTQLIEVVAVCDKHKKIVNGLKFPNGSIRFVSNDYRQVVSRKDVGAVIIATPPETHYQIAKASLMSGKHVLMEKPMTIKKGHALELSRLADRKKLTLMVDHTYIYAKPIQKIRFWI